MTFKAKGGVAIEGLDKLRKDLDALGTSAARRVAKTAVRKAAKPVAKHAKSIVRIRTGNLRKSIASYAKMSKRHKGVAIAVIGPRRRFTKVLGVITRGENIGHPKKTTATNIAHLVELGHGKAESGKLRYSRKQQKLIKNKQAGKKMKGAGSVAPAYPFMQPALTQSKSSVRTILSYELAEGIKKEAAKLAAKGK